MINITEYIKQSGNNLQLTRKYFSLLPPEEFERVANLLHSPELSLEQRKENYENIKPLIYQFKEIFKQRIIGLNKLARSLGFANQLEYFLALAVIPSEDYGSFLKNIDEFVSLVHSDLLSIERVKEIKDWSILSIPAPDGNFYLENKFDVPDQVLDLISRYDPRISKYSNRIDIEFDDDSFDAAGTRYVMEEDRVRIRLKRDLVGLDKTLIFVHALGNALDFLDCEDKKIISFTLPKYLQSYSAVEFTHKFIKKEISDKGQKYIRYNVLHTLASTFFEIDIFINDQQDFDQAYARAINRCYPMTHQIENPLYVFNSRFISRPLGMLIQNMADVEFYLKDAKTTHASKNI